MTQDSQDRRTPRQALGAYGERVAAAYLEDVGLEVLDRNWRCSEGEIDLVLREGTVLVVCEVKTRTGEDGAGPHEAITPTKLERLTRLAERWQAEHDLRAPEVRIDLVAVHHPARGAARVEHVRGLV
ncbi:YraN family protein [uncultured Nocardioides sp.]|uniref:YraN family protein n=1 Tax=uncultured Nocardioides sp. TaxID=198441 RepID=UPI000C53BCF8|nr:YraN family protein [Nocardioides sp.]|tara:strand:- start:581 stop:961 length:381 start_codon:yes stop_codon:yes gene_type:complete